MLVLGSNLLSKNKQASENFLVGNIFVSERKE